MRRAHAFSRPTTEATHLLGQRVRLGRLERRMPIAELAERVGVAEGTMRRVEAGDPTVALGIAFEAAVIVGVPLFSEDAERRRLESELVGARLAVLPTAVRRSETDDAF